MVLLSMFRAAAVFVWFDELQSVTARFWLCLQLWCFASVAMYCIVLIALSRCNREFTRRLRLCHSHTVYRREVRKGGREGPNRVESEV